MSISEELTAKILAEIQSESLRAAMEENRPKFTETELFFIIARFCPRFERRQTLLKLLRSEAKEAVAARAENFRAYEARKLGRFAMPVENAVYLVGIREKGCSGKTEDLFKDFEKAVAYCKNFDGEIVDGKIEKKLPIDCLPEDKQDDDWLGCCKFDKDVEFLSVWDNDEKEEYDAGYIWDERIFFPLFLKSYDPVKFTDYHGKTVYGFVLIDDEYVRDDGTLDNAYVIRLTDNMERYTFGLPLDFELDTEYFSCYVDMLMFQGHEHIDLPKLEKVEYEELPEKWKPVYDRITEDYRTFLKESLRPKGKQL